MCGLGAVIRAFEPGGAPTAGEESVHEHWLDAMDSAVAHRGPDGAGRFRDRQTRPDGSVVEIALVHRRLSIIDHAGGGQPMVRETPGGKLAVVFNGCIYNHRALRAELEGLGERFVTGHSDTEVILAGWARWRFEVFRRLNGMFSILLWDGRDGTFVVSRDAFGEKPLYGITDGRVSAYANVPRALGGFPQSARGAADGPEAAAVEAADVLYFGAVRWVGRFRGVEQAEPGGTYSNLAATDTAYQTVFAGLRQERRHGASSLRRGASRFERETATDGIARMLETAVLDRLEADVPVAALLSGGVDSSLVCALAKRSRPDLLTLCVRMPDDRYDESGHARRVAEHLEMPHRTVEAGERPAEDLVRLINLLGHPFGDSSLLPTFWACRAAREHAKVVLTGDGGDEVFLGYERYQAVDALAVLRILRPLLVLSPLSRGAATEPTSRAAKFARLLGAARGRGYTDLVAIFPILELCELVSPRIARQAGTDRATSSEAVEWDVSDHFPNVLLRKVDHAAMAAGVETRAPFLDHRLAAAVLPLGRSVLCPRGERKGLLRAIARRHLPAGIVDRPKQGFAIPIGEWFRTDYGGLKALLTDALGSADPFPESRLGVEISMATVRRIVDEHMEGRRDHSQRLFMLLSTAIWCRSAA